MSGKGRPGWGEEPPPPPHIWHTLGYRGVEQEEGRTTIEWDAGDDYCFTGSSGPIVQGGMVTTLLDTAMGAACWSVLEDGQSFLTADLRTEFLRAARPGTLRATGTVVHRTRRIVFCAAELRGPDGAVLATARCTQVVRG